MNEKNGAANSIRRPIFCLNISSCSGYQGLSTWSVIFLAISRASWV
ncbi:MAG: hypothetical protein ACI8ZW_002538, partial [Yoonia sp.]